VLPGISTRARYWLLDGPARTQSPLAPHLSPSLSQVVGEVLLIAGTGHPLSE